MSSLQVSGLRVAYQGEPGSYSDLAVEQVYGRWALPLPQPTFAAVFQAVRAGTADVGLVPLENSYAGRVAEVERLLDCADFAVIGDSWLRIEHCLLCLPGQRLSDIREVRSHPQALAQCDAYLCTLPIDQVATLDTAGSAKCVSEKHLSGVAAIASRRAADLYHLSILAQGIQTSADNQTHFLLLRWALERGREEDGSLLHFQGLPVEGPSVQREVVAHPRPFARPDRGVGKALGELNHALVDALALPGQKV